MQPSSWRHPNFGLAIVLGAMALLPFAWAASQPVLHDSTVVRGGGGIVGGITTNDGDDYFRLQGDDAVYIIRANPLQMRNVLDASSASGHAVTFSLHLDGAMLDSDDEPRYWVESMEFRGRKYGPFAPRVRKSWRALSAAQATLLRAIAFDRTGQDAAALRELDAVDLGSLSRPLRASALKTRGGAADDLAYAHRRAVNDDDDVLLLRALRDLRAAAKLAPDDYELLQWQGSVLTTLGDYQQALATYAAVAKRWPEHHLRTVVLRAATYRIQGENQQALRELELARVPGDNQGMMFHYHRACARAHLGLLDQAIADQKTALAGFEKVAQLASTRAAADVVAEHRGILHDLERAASENPGRPTDAGCARDYSNPRYSRREPSRLLTDH